MPGTQPNVVSTVANSVFPSNTFACGDGFELKGSLTKRHLILEQSHPSYLDAAQVRHVRAYESNDNGLTWAEKDAANAIPLIATVPGGAFTSNYAVTQDYDGKLLYLVHWGTNAVHPALSITPFDQVLAKWGTTVTSTLVVLGGVGQGDSLTSAAFRPSDGSIWASISLGRISGFFKDSVVKFDAGTLAATSADIWPTSAASNQCLGIALNPVDNTLVGAMIVGSDLYSFVIHTDDTISTPNIFTGVPFFGQLSRVRCSAAGEAILSLGQGISSAAAQVYRWISADVPASYTLDVVAFTGAGPGQFPNPIANMTGGGYSYIFYSYKVPANSTIVFAFRKAITPGGTWDPEEVFFTFDNSTAAFMNNRIVASFLPAGFRALTTQYLATGASDQIGQCYIEDAAPTPPPPPAATAWLPQFMKRVN